MIIGKAVMKTFARIIFLVIWIMPPAVAKAENWVSVLTEPPTYVDTDSISRKGDLATIVVKQIYSGAKTGTWTFVCFRGKVVGRGPTEPIEVMDLRDEQDKVIFAKACKRPWEIWK